MNLKIITTGGTIDKTYSTNRGTESLSIGEPSIERIFERIPYSVEYKLTELYRIDSLNMKRSDRRKISQEVRETAYQNILITHGTDGMVETARHLKEQNFNKSIVLVGASKPEVFKHSDADINVGGALSALDLIDDTVKIAIHGRVHDPMNVRKNENGIFQSLDE